MEDKGVEQHYLAGPDLEQKEEQLKKGCRIVLGCTRTDRNSKKKYRLATPFQKDEWWKFVDVKRVSVLPKEKTVIRSKYYSKTDNVFVLTTEYTIHKLPKKSKEFKRQKEIEF